MPFCFSSSDGNNNFEWCGSFLKSILLNPWVLCNIEIYRLIADFIWLQCWALDTFVSRPLAWAFCAPDFQVSLSTEEYLSNEGYSGTFYDNYLSPLLSALWKTNAGRFLPRLPFDALMRCLNDSQILYPRRAAPKWQRINMGVNQLAQTMTREFPPDRVHLKVQVHEISFCKKKYCLLTSSGQPMYFDHVVFAVDSREVLRLLNLKLSVEEREIIQNFKVAQNIAVLHSDVLVRTNSYPIIIL